MSADKVFVLGLDGATFDVIEPMVREGRLPAFRRLMDAGTWGPLESVANQRSAAAWTSFMTGLNPGRHGVFEFYDYLPREYNLRFINGSARAGDSLWRILGRHARRVGVINVPMTYPAEEVNGFLIAGLDCPSVRSRGFTHPESLAAAMAKRVGEYMIEPGLTGAVVGGRADEAVRLIRRELGQKMDLTRWLMQTEPWDFFMVVLRSLDAVQHAFWKAMTDPQSGGDPAASPAFRTVIPETYEMIDGFLGELMTDLEKQGATLMVMSDHGFGAKHPATSQLNAWLAAQGLLAYADGAGGGRGGLLRPLYKAVVGLTSRRMKEWLWERFPGLRDRVQSRLCFAGLDWTRTRAYSDSLFANVRINLRGRERDGIVEPGEASEKILARLTRELADLRDAKTGERIVQAVFRREEVYEGRYVEKAPELLIRWREDIPISGIRMPDGAAPDGAAAPPIPGEDCRFVSGDHHLNGVFLSYGTGIHRGRRMEGARIIDLAPTILYRMGLPIPTGMEGRILSDAFEPAVLRSRKPAYEQPGAAEAAPGATPGGYDAAEEETIRARLRDLGYVE